MRRGVGCLALSKKNKFEIDDRVWKKLQKKIAKAAVSHVRVGVLGESGDDVYDGSGATVLEIAAFHELGTATVPERSFIRRTFRMEQDKLARAINKLAQQIVTDKLTVEGGLNVLGTWGVSRIKNAIVSGPGIPPPLADSTIEAKGSTRPLVDTGRLLNSITHSVER